MIFAALWISIAALSAPADEKPISSTTIEGHSLSIQSVESAPSRIGVDGNPGKDLTIGFAASPNDAAKSYGYEIGQRFVARDADGKEIPLGRVNSRSRSGAFFRLAGYPVVKSERLSPFGDSMTIQMPLLKGDLSSIATLEGDLFVSEVELLEFTFNRNELNPNVVKTAGGGEAKLFLYDETERGVEVGFKLRLPIRSRAESLAGSSFGFGNEQYLLFATEAGRKTSLNSRGGSGSGTGGDASGDFRLRMTREFHLAGVSPQLEAVHLVIPQIEYPQRLKFQLKDVPAPAPAAKPMIRPPLKTKAKGIG